MASNQSKIIQKEPFLHWIVTKCFMVRRNSLQLGGDFVVCKNSARAFLYISLPSLHDYDVKIPNYTCFMEDANKRRRNVLSLSKLECSLQEINSREIRPY